MCDEILLLFEVQFTLRVPELSFLHHKTHDKREIRECFPLRHNLINRFQRIADVEDVKFVINFDYPSNSEDYVHRIGRTGRSQRTGTAYTFFTPSNANKAADLVSVLKEAKQVINPKLQEMADTRSWVNGNGGRGTCELTCCRRLFMFVALQGGTDGEEEGNNNVRHLGPDQDRRGDDGIEVGLETVFVDIVLTATVGIVAPEQASLLLQSRKRSSPNPSWLLIKGYRHRQVRTGLSRWPTEPCSTLPRLLLYRGPTSPLLGDFRTLHHLLLLVNPRFVGTRRKIFAHIHKNHRNVFLEIKVICFLSQNTQLRIGILCLEVRRRKKIFQSLFIKNKAKSTISSIEVKVLWN